MDMQMMIWAAILAVVAVVMIANMQMMIWAAILAVVAVVMIARTFGKARETVVSNDHIFDGETGQRVNNWKYITEDDGE